MGRVFSTSHVRKSNLSLCILYTGCPSEDLPIAISPWENGNIYVPFFVFYEIRRDKVLEIFHILLNLMFW